MKRMILAALLVLTGLLLLGGCGKEERVQPALMFENTLYDQSDEAVPESTDGFTKVGTVKERLDADRTPNENGQTNVEIAEGEGIYICGENDQTLYVYSGRWLRFEKEAAAE
ncbi:MAG: hypothetical protein VB085_08035 [Peptococcaceae bacterium]|nr:hypothetical protein [Peptococcaceae bacterium]